MTSIPRRYDNSRRRAGAAVTEQRIVDAAGACFGESGYGATTLAAVAARAEVSVETIKKTLGTKPQLLRRWFDQTVAGPEGVAPTETSWVVGLADIDDLHRRIEATADAVTLIMERTAIAVAVMSAAAQADPVVAGMWAAERRERFSDVERIASLVIGDALGPSERERVVDISYAITEASLYRVLTEERGWTPSQYRDWFADMLTHLIDQTAPHNNEGKTP
jgi:AcrR family transcriptional regulator